MSLRPISAAEQAARDEYLRKHPVRPFVSPKPKASPATRRWQKILISAAFGILGLLLAYVALERHMKATRIRTTWHQVQGSVVRMEEVPLRGRRGTTNYMKRATVAFMGPDGSYRQGLLFHELLSPGQQITVFVDPQKSYDPSGDAYNGAREVWSSQRVADEADGASVAAAMVWLVGSIACLVYSWMVLQKPATS